MLRLSKSLAVDCEGERLGRNGRLTLVQIASEQAVFLFDVVAFGGSEREVLISTLKALLESQSIVKILHDCRQDAAALHYQLGITLQNVLDTQVAYAMIDATESAARGSEPDGRRIGLNPLLSKANLSVVAMKDSIKDKMDQDVAFWSRRY